MANNDGLPYAGSANITVDLADGLAVAIILASGGTLDKSEIDAIDSITARLQQWSENSGNAEVSQRFAKARQQLRLRYGEADERR